MRHILKYVIMLQTLICYFIKCRVYSDQRLGDNSVRIDVSGVCSMSPVHEHPVFP